MENFETIEITTEDGKKAKLKVITILKKPEEDKSFLLYTFDETSENIDIYASIIKEENGGYVLDAISDKDDWELVQKAIQELSE